MSCHEGLAMLMLLNAFHSAALGLLSLRSVLVCVLKTDSQSHCAPLHRWLYSIGSTSSGYDVILRCGYGEKQFR